MRYCKNCLQPDTRPNEKFQNGVCSICSYYDSVSGVEWELRFDQLPLYVQTNTIRRCVPRSSH